MENVLPSKTIINNISNTTVLIDNIYYDLINKQFIINDDEIYNHKLRYTSWHGRNNPVYIGKSIIYKKIIENTTDIIIGDELHHIVLARRYSPHNFGHLLCETAIPIEHVFNSIGIKSKSDRSIIFDDSSWDGYNDTKENSIYWFEGDDINRRHQCDLHSNNIFSSMASTIIFDFNKYITEQKYNGRFLKIKNKVIFGIGNISPWVRCWNNNFNMSDTIDSYVTKLYNRYLSSISYNNTEQNTLTFIVKIGRRQVLNWQEVGEVLNNCAIENGMKYEQINLDNIAFNEQIEILSRTKFLVTNGGSAAFSSLLLCKSNRINMLYFPLLNNDFESTLFKNINRFNLIEYEKYDVNWKQNIARPDGSYIVDLQILSMILHQYLPYNIDTVLPS